MSDMKHNLLFLCAAALGLAACTKDEPTDDTRLPYGEYPLQIAAVTLSVEGGEAQPWGAPQTRVSENADGTGSVFDAYDQFSVQIEGDTQTAIYTVQSDGSVMAENLLFWSDRDDHTVNAWYPATDGTLDLRDQDTNGLAYLLHGTGTGDYLTPVTLTFTHSLAKVRVTPSDAIGDNEVTSLQLFTYRTCTHNQGEVVQGMNEGWIEMKPCEYNGVTYWEANVVPGYEITKLIANDDGKERTLSATIKPEAGNFYNITLNNDKGYTDEGNGNYTVTTAEGLKAVADIANNSNRGINITLDKDIDLTGTTWTPIGTTYNNSYTGTFDGGGNTITGLTVTGSNEYAGLFGYIGSGGTVKNVVLKDVQIESDNQYGCVGGVAGNSDGDIENCSVSGSVSSRCTAGGVVGQQYSGSITLCGSSATVKGTGEVGGVAGKTDNSATLTACYATGNVTFERASTINTFAGGVVGFNGTGSILTACYATGNVTGTGTGTGSCYVGGVTGDNASGTLNGRQCFGHPDRLLPCYGDCQRPGWSHRRRNGSKLYITRCPCHHRLLLGRQRSGTRHRLQSGGQRRNHEGGRLNDMGNCHERHERGIAECRLAVRNRYGQSACIKEKRITVFAPLLQPFAGNSGQS